MDAEFARLLKECGEKFSESPAFIYQGKERTETVFFPQFEQDIEKMRTYCEKFSAGRIGLWGENSYEWIVASAALLIEGKTVVLLDANLPDEDVRRLCEYSDVQLVMADEDRLDAEETLGIPVVCLSPDTSEKAPENLSEGENRQGSFVCFTSGTSKSSKGVVIDTSTLCGYVRDYGDVVKGDAGDIFYLPLPYHHIYAFTYIFHILYRGGTNGIGQMGKYFIRDMEVLSPQLLFTVPSMLRYMLEKDYFPGQLRLILCGGSYLRPELAEQIRQKGVPLCNLYGSSEVLGAIAFSTREKGSQWLCPAGANRFVLNDQGELGVKLPYHMKEYYQKPEDTLQVLDAEQHIFWTGDAADMDGDGYVRIRGRVRDMIVLENGEKVHAEDTDEQLCGIPGVGDGAVIGTDGQLTAVLIPNGELSEEELLREIKKFNRNRPAALRIKNIWIYQGKFPRTNTGKLRRFLLEQEYAARGR